MAQWNGIIPIIPISSMVSRCVIGKTTRPPRHILEDEAMQLVRETFLLSSFGNRFNSFHRLQFQLNTHVVSADSQV